MKKKLRDMLGWYDRLAESIRVDSCPLCPESDRNYAAMQYVEMCGQCAACKQAAQIAVASFANAAELFLAAARVLLWHQPNPGWEVSS
jgi:hypothetical protein